MHPLDRYISPGYSTKSVVPTLKIDVFGDLSTRSIFPTPPFSGPQDILLAVECLGFENRSRYGVQHPAPGTTQNMRGLNPGTYSNVGPQEIFPRFLSRSLSAIDSPPPPNVVPWHPSLWRASIPRRRRRRCRWRSPPAG